MDRRLETLQDEVVDTMNNNGANNWNSPQRVNEDLVSLFIAFCIIHFNLIC